MTTVLESLETIDERIIYLETVRDTAKDFIRAIQTKGEALQSGNEGYILCAVRNEQLIFQNLLELIPLD